MLSRIRSLAFTAAAIATLLFKAELRAQILTPPGMCWRTLAPDIGPEDVNVLSEGASLAAANAIVWLKPDARIFRWSGDEWTTLPALTKKGVDQIWPEVIAPSPSGRLTVVGSANREDGGAELRIWVAWTAAGEQVRVARWDGARWSDIGREALDRITASQGSTALRQLSLAVDSKGQVWLLRLAETETGHPEIALARWEGTTWTAVTAPRYSAVKNATTWSAAMILRNDLPVIAWSQSDVTDNHHLYVSEWVRDQWIPRLVDLHLVEGVSNVESVSLAAGNGSTLFVSWDEPGKDKHRTRLAQVHTCAPGESPAMPPASTIERDTWPTTVNEAAESIVATMDEDSKGRVRTTKKEQLGEFYFGWGMGIRNSLGLWRGNEKLLESCGNGTKADPEACSMVIIEAVWTLLQPLK